MRLLLLTIFTCITITSFTQDFNPKILKKYKEENRTFVFETLSIKNNKDKRKDQKEAYNNSLKKILSNYWNIDAPYVLLSREEAKEYVKKNKKSLMFVDIGSDTYWDTNSANRLKVYTVKGALERVIPFIHVALSNEVSEADLIYAINTLQFIYNDAEKYKSLLSMKKTLKNNQHLLSKKTLLLPQELMDKKLTENAVTKVYDYPFKIVPKKEIKQAIVSMRDDCLVIYDAQLLSKNGAKPLWVIYDPIDGTIVNLVHGSLSIQESIPLSRIVSNYKGQYC